MGRRETIQTYLGREIPQGVLYPELIKGQFPPAPPRFEWVPIVVRRRGRRRKSLR